jgi:hypothetical protein
MPPPPPPLDALLDALRAEADALDAFAARADAQVAALGAPSPQHITDAAAATAEAVIAMDAARQVRERAATAAASAAGLPEDAPLKALAAALPPPDAARVLAAREHTRARARHADARCDALGFAMSYAAALGREMLDAWHRLDVPRPARVYTAAGAAASAAPAPARLDQTG